MQSNYKSLGEHIRLVKVKNTNDSVKELLGINIDKFFMPSVANIVGTDLSKYQIVQKNQFACNRMHVGRDYRIPVAKSNSNAPFIVSPAYDVFEVIDENILLPDYLMLWFKRREFDRNAWFYTDADVRGGLNWKAFINMQLPVPCPEKQQELIEEYGAIENRIQLNKKFCATLEETAQTMYKHWFEDFEFPDGSGKPYKSSGGEMVECEELGKEIPKGWRVGKLDELLLVCYGKSYSKLSAGSIPMYGSGGIMSYVNESLYNSETVLIPRKGSLNNIMFINTPFWSVDTMFYSKPKIENVIPYAFQFLRKYNFSNSDQGSAVPSMTTSFLNDMQILIPDLENLQEYKSIFSILFESIEMKNSQTQKLEELKSLLLGKMAVES